MPVVDLNMDPFGNLTSLPYVKKGKHGYHALAEIGGKWVYIDGVLTTRGKGTDTVLMMNALAVKLAELHPEVRIGSHWSEDVRSWYIWKPDKESP